MAALGTTELEAVNQVLSYVDILPVTSIAASEDATEAQRVLQTVNIRLQRLGLLDNTSMAVEFTGDGSNQITFGSDVIGVNCVAPGRFRDTVVIREDHAFSTRENSDAVFTNGSKFYFDIIREVPFENLSEATKQAIIMKTIVEFRRIRMYNTELDMKLSADADGALAQLIVNRPPASDASTLRSALIGSPQGQQ